MWVDIIQTVESINRIKSRGRENNAKEESWKVTQMKRHYGLRRAGILRVREETGKAEELPVKTE